MRLRREADYLVCAVQFLTRLPTPPLPAFEPDWINRAARYFPVAGQLVGLLVGAVFAAASGLWPGLPAATLSLLAGLLITGGFHEDGLADAADGLFGGADRARRLEIMKDSRIGSFGAMALATVLLAKAALLARLGALEGALALVCAHGGARAAAVVVMAWLPYAGDPRAAKAPTTPDGPRSSEALVAAVLGLWPLALLKPAAGILALALLIAGTLALALLARRLIAGYTGDVLGAVESCGELAVLMGAAAARS